MTAIDISARETVSGITLSLSVSVSHEALLHELEVSSGPQKFSYIPTDLLDEFSLEASQEASRVLATMRSKLRLNLVSSYSNYLKEEFISVSAGSKEDLAAELLKHCEKILKDKGILK